ncbi:MAG TPA: response regulator transcription factor [Arthrobacter sp.]|nr:response regulator transcription factor [Arthrobacter sp.]
MMADPDAHESYPLAGRGVYLLDDHEVIRRGLRQLLESAGLVTAGESGSAREALRRIPALRPELVILDDDLPDGAGAEVCRTLAVTAPGIRCVLMTADIDEAVLIDSILAGAWGCLSKRDDSSEQLRLIRRVLAGNTAFSARFHPALLAPFSLPGHPRPDESLLRLSRQEMTAAIGVGRGLSNREISQEMFLSEKTVKNMVSSILMKLGMARRTQVAVLVSRTLSRSEDSDDVGYRSSRFPDLVAEVMAALLACTSEAATMPSTVEGRAGDAGRLADALTAARTGPTVIRPPRRRT